MTDTQTSLDFIAEGVTMHPYYDAYLDIPYGTKGAIMTRNFAKNLGARYDSIENRWWIPHKRIVDSIDQIRQSNLFDSWKFVYNGQTDNKVYQPNFTLSDFNHLNKIFTGNPVQIMANGIDVGGKKNRTNNQFSVIFFTSKEGEAVNIIYWSSEVNHFTESIRLHIQGKHNNYENFPCYMIRKQIVIPKDLARPVWAYYLKQKNSKQVSIPSDLVNSYYFMMHGVNVTNVWQVCKIINKGVTYGRWRNQFY